MDKSTYENLLARQREFYYSGRTRGYEFRERMLRRLKCALREYEQRLLEALAIDIGKPAFEAYASEIAVSLTEIEYSLANLKNWMRPKCKDTPLMYFPATSKVISEPYGVALIIAPWNYPVQLVIAPLVGAIAAGNCAVIKTSELAPRTAAVVCDMLEHTFASEYIACVRGAAAETTALLALPFDVIFYTGSTRVGRIVMRAAAEHLTPVILELGGKSPCIVDASANLAVAARRIAWSKFFNAGQTCVAPDYLYVHSSVVTKFLALLTEQIVKFYGNEPRDSADYARIINAQHFERLISYLDCGVLRCGGQHDAHTRYIAPTILTQIDWDTSVMSDEIFGPILPVLEYSAVEDITILLREKPKALAAYVFSNDAGVIKHLTDNIACGGLCVNDCIIHMANCSLPFGGVGASGMGKYHGSYSFECFSHFKAILKHGNIMDIAFRYPPYPMLKTWLKLLLKWFG